MTPKAIIWAKWLSIIQGALSVLMIIGYFWLATQSVGTTSSFWVGFFGNAATQPLTPYDIGTLIGMPFMIAIASLLLLVAIKKRSEGFGMAGIILFGLVILSSLNQGGFPPILPIIVFILALRRSSREYLQISKVKTKSVEKTHEEK